MAAEAITILCSSPAIDRTVALDRLRRGGDHRARRAELRGGGKGGNVARALARTGVGFHLILPVGGAMGRALVALFDDEGLPTVSVPVEGTTRSSLVVVDEGSVTIVNDPSTPLTRADWERTLATVTEALAPRGLLVCSGSLPRGLGPPAVREFVDVGRRAGARTLVDSSGEGLAGALAAGADVVLPNVGEAAAVLGREPPKPDVQAAGSLAEAAALASALCAAGARAAVVTAGAAGAAVAEAGEVVGLVPAPEVRVTNPVGAGDCLVAGVAAKLASGAGLLEATTWGVALAAASCETFTAADVDPARADELLRASAAAREGAYGP